ncbi:MAG: hypothetical protein QOC56_2863 [Alphaproteobacteria bacterium]|jgi:hypothetical protein|nr:hypothetical protein [Alphaproteobacteria bacterium]MEA2939359.1 hypothetical protein [Alphaproteobacteria bacterium]
MPNTDELVAQEQILASARDGIYEIRRRLAALKPRLSTHASDAINMARQELCTALVRRLEIAEREIAELQDMIALDRKA